jgi:hypothetical protein
MDVDATPHKIPISHTENRISNHFGVRYGFGIILDFNVGMSRDYPPIKTTKETLTYKSRVEPNEKYRPPPPKLGVFCDLTGKKIRRGAQILTDLC